MTSSSRLPLAAAGPAPPAPSLIPTLLLLLLLAPLLALSPWAISAALVGLCGVYVAYEFALVKVSIRSLQKDAARGVRGAHQLLAMKQDMNAMLAACQFGITVTSLGLTLALEPAIHHLLEAHFAPLLQVVGRWVEPKGFSIGLAMVAGSLFHVTFGELVPKGLALIVPLQVLYRTAPFMSLFRWVAIPFIKTCNGVANLVVKLLTGRDPEQISHDEDVDLREALIHASSKGQIAPQQARLMKNVLSFAERTAREVMTPAKSVVSVRLQDSWDEVKRVMEENRFSRYPVVDGDWHKVVGYVRHIDVLRADAQQKRDLKPLVRPIDRRPETVPVSQLNLFQGSPLVAIYDEHDAFVGLLSAEDVVEEIVGEIYDETDERVAAAAIQKLPDGKLRVSGALLLEQVAEQLALRDTVADDTDVDTIGGLVLKRLGRQPAVGDEVVIGPWKVAVEEATGFKITRLRFEPQAPTAAAP